MWNFINTEVVNTTQTQNITHTMTSHNNESALTIVVPRHAFAEISFKRKNQFTRYAYIGKFIQAKEKTNLFIIAKKKINKRKKKVSSGQKKKKKKKKYKCWATHQSAV